MNSPTPKNATEIFIDSVQAEKLPAFDYRPLKEAMSKDIETPSTNRAKIICKDTGILAHLEIPSIQAIVFDYRHPLAFPENCIALIKRGHKQLARLDSTILAGMVISLYRQNGLLRILGTAIEANRMLSTLPAWELCKALHIAPKIPAVKLDLLPIFSLDWKTHKDSTVSGFSSNFMAWVNTLASEVDLTDLEIYMTESATTGIPVYELQSKHLRNQAAAALFLAQKARKEQAAARLAAQSAAEMEAEFRRNRVAAKLIISGLIEEGIIEGKLAEVCASLTVGSALKVLPEASRAKLISRLERIHGDSRIPDLIRILRATSAPDDAFSDALEDSKPVNAVPVRKLSLAEIIAAKKAGK